MLRFHVKHVNVINCSELYKFMSGIVKYYVGSTLYECIMDMGCI